MAWSSQCRLHIQRPHRQGASSSRAQRCERIGSITQLQPVQSQRQPNQVPGLSLHKVSQRPAVQPWTRAASPVAAHRCVAAGAQLQQAAGGATPRARRGARKLCCSSHPARGLHQFPWRGPAQVTIQHTATAARCQDAGSSGRGITGCATVGPAAAAGQADASYAAAWLSAILPAVLPATVQSH